MFRWFRKVMQAGNSSHVLSSYGRFTRRFLHSSGPSTSKRTYYEVLGVKPMATTQEIRDAFVRLSKKYHPDVNKDDKQAHERFVELNEAYSVLSKNDSRREYDAKLRQGWPRGEPPQYYDPVRERYRQYYEELNRMRRPPPGFSKYAGPPPEDPIRDFWRDFEKAFGQQQQEQQRWSRPGPGIRMDAKANRAFYMFIMALVTISVIVHFLQYALIREKGRQPYDYGDYDQWRDVIIVDRPEPEPKDKKSEEYSPSPSRRNDRFVES